jgi:DNA-binding NarL/FixJ family response regulator
MQPDALHLHFLANNPIMYSSFASMVANSRLPVYLNYLPSKGEARIMAKAAGKPKTRKSLANLEPPPRAKRPESLTSREQEILELIWAGFKNKEIGQRLKISVKTVEAHRANMMKKLRVSNTAQLLKTAIQSGALKIR